MPSTNTESVLVHDEPRRPRGRKPKAHRGLCASEMTRLVDEARYLVPMCARRYLGRGVPFDDLVGAGHVGLVEAVYRYDAGRGVKFGTYAVWWIRKALSAAVERESSIVIVPRYSLERRRRVLEAMEGKHTSEAAGAFIGLSPEQVGRAMTSRATSVSLETPTTQDGRRTLGDDLAVPAHKGPESLALMAEMLRRTGTAFAALSERQRLVVALRFGLGTTGDEPATLTDIARVLDLSRERVRQIEAEALVAIRRALGAVGATPGRRSSS